MAVFKCKMCGATLEVNNNQTVATCEYCATQQTLPKLDDDKRANMYDRANHFRRNNEFDKAMGIYEQILNEDSTDAEAYWSLVLCRYGIEYVKDPTSKKRIPTVNRTQFTSIFEDDNYKSALQYADGSQRDIYEKEAKAINEIQKGILSISQKEEPFDIFICYKETDNSGRRTPDSVLAQELYYQLTKEGFKVFFSRITLEDKLGTAYEPYIFAALNSAKVMVVLGTQPEFFNAVWVKNEWSRYLGLIKQGQNKTLIPAYRDMDPYDLPEEFSHLQAQDMAKLGFMQDLIRGIQKIVQSNKTQPSVIKETVVASANTNTAPLLKRAYIFLKDGIWDRANEYFEKVLDVEPENAKAYVGLLLCDLQIKTEEELSTTEKEFHENYYYRKALEFASAEYKQTLLAMKQEQLYQSAKRAYDYAASEDAYKSAESLFISISGYKDADTMSQKCAEKAETARLKALERAEEERKESIYQYARRLKYEGTIKKLAAAIVEFKKIPAYKDVQEQILECEKRIPEIQAELDRLNELAVIEQEKTRKQNIKFFIIAACASIVIALSIIGVGIATSKNQEYDQSQNHEQAQTYKQQIEQNYLTKFTIPDGVISIEVDAFKDCDSLTSITIPSSVTFISGGAFIGCSNLTSITFKGTTAQWNSIEKGNYWQYDIPATTVVCSDGNVSI